MLLALELTRTRLLDAARSVAPMAALAAVGLLVFGWMCDAVGDRDGITSVDRPLSLWIASHRSVTEGHLGLLLAKATSPAVLVSIVAVTSLALWLRRYRFEAGVLAVTVVAAYGVGGLAKIAEHRARPTAPINLAPETEGSFPSGHVLIVATIAIVAIALSWVHLSTAGRAIAVAAGTLATAAIATDRLLVGAHFLTDVVGSLALAAVFGAVVMGVLSLRGSARSR